MVAREKEHEGKLNRQWASCLALFLTVYTGILGIVPGNCFRSMQFPHYSVSAAVSKAAAALLGDLASSVSGVGVLFQQKPYVTAFLQQCSQDRSMAETAKWAAQMVQKAMHSG